MLNGEGIANMELKNILCPVDFSPLSALGLRYAGVLAQCGNAQLSVAYANTFAPPPYFTESKLRALEEQYRESFHEAEAALRRFVDANVQGELARRAGLFVEEGLPVDVIRRIAAQIRADLIVMGTHGRTGVNRWMLGSVAERVLRESAIPVLTVRGDTSAPAESPKKILCPVNDTPAAQQAIVVASQIGRCFDSSVTAVHVHERGDANRIEDLCAWIPPEARSHCAVTEMVREGDAETEIIGLAKALGADLLVIGVEHRRFFDATVLGSTAARVVRHAPCPVMTVPRHPE